MSPTLMVPVPGAELAVWELGSGPAVVLVHGGTGTAGHDWSSFGREVSDQFRVIGPDLRGHGGSHHEVDPREDPRFNIIGFGDDLVAVLAHLGLRSAGFVGFSVGANVVLALAVRRPDVVRAMVLVGASARGRPERIDDIVSGPWPAGLQALAHVSAGGSEHWRVLRAALAEDWAHHLRLDPGLKSVTAPTLLCQGDHDELIDVDDAVELHRTIPESQLLIVPGAGHAAHLNAPEFVGPVMRRFLERALLSGPGT